MNKDKRILKRSSEHLNLIRSSKFIRSYHRNVLQDGFDCEEFQHQKADAVFLDLPKPETAIEFAHQVLKLKGRLCSFSPCIEQISATAAVLAKFGFVNLNTIECVERNYYRKITMVKDVVTQTETKLENLQLGDKLEKTHTGYLLFATKMI